MMPRTLLALAAGCLCGAIGVRRAARLRQRAAALQGWVRFGEKLQLCLREGGSTLPEALLQAATENDLPSRRIQETARRMQGDPTLTLADAYVRAAQPPAPCETEADRSLQVYLMQGVGRGTLENRKLCAEQATALLRTEAAAAAEKAARDVRLALTLGWTAGACVTILLL